MKSSTKNGDIDVCVKESATITAISDGSSESGTIADIVAGLTAYAFGELNLTDGCFYASDVVIDTGE